jgi:GTPase SAR1 family protein
VSLESLATSNEDGYESESAADKALLDESVEEEEELQAVSEFVSQVLSHVDEGQRNLVCLRYGIIDRVATSPDPRQEVREVFRQAACKAIMQKSMSTLANSQTALLRVEELPAD